MWRKKPLLSSTRLIHINQQEKNQFCSNKISTAKYKNPTILVVKFLWEQFTKAANIFFGFIVILQFQKGISPTSKFTTLGPLLVVLFVSFLKEMHEDSRRKKADREVNSRPVLKLTNLNFESVRWDKLQVGDIVKLNSGEHIPADIILLSSSEPDGICYVETSNLDGETNLKIKQSHPETSKILTPEQVSKINGTIECEHPNNNLYTFSGNFKHLKTIPLKQEQLLLRGAQLRNTLWVYGIVVFTGHDAKLLQNAHATPIKRTSMELLTNVQVVFLFGILITMASVCSLGGILGQYQKISYLEFQNLTTGQIALQAFKDFLTYIVLFNNLIPISLIVTMEIVKYRQANSINLDLEMYHEETDTPALCRTSSLVDELGQIGYVFSDKTGTLTCNIMEFKRCCIGGIKYGGDYNAFKSNLPNTQSFMELKQQKTELNHHFLLLLSSCHTVIPEKPSTQPPVMRASFKEPEIRIEDDLQPILEQSEQEQIIDDILYQASSPDEGALVNGARNLGYVFHQRRPQSIKVQIESKDLEIQVLNILEFNSTRKRMSAILRIKNQIILYCKGADTVIMERIKPSTYLDETLKALDEYATEGLRTLCLAYRIIPEDEYEGFQKLYEEASNSIIDRQQKLDDVAEIVEKDMILLGATAIEDKLQDGVPETIATLISANIKVWVLTGDRQETAINIGYSCRLLSEEMNLLILNYPTFEETKLELEKLKLINDKDLALIIDGHTLTFALNEEIEQLFLEISCKCRSVICCRVSPLQKAMVVKLVKKYKKTTVLAIGDGANDVSMIQAAHVGIGISGQEGMQAARSADFAISQFRFLSRLLMIHGTWSYDRLSKVVLYCFYKNITLYCTQFWFSLYNGFSGQTIYESWLISFYNVLFTAAPPFAIGFLDQFASSRMLERYPMLYLMGQQKEFFNVKVFWSWTLNGFIHSLILFFCVTKAYENDLMHSYSSGLWVMSLTLYSCVLITVLLKSSLVATLWSRLVFLGSIGSAIAWFALLPIYTTVGPMLNFAQELKHHTQVMSTLKFWLCVLLVPCICLVRDFSWKYYKRMYNTRPYHVVQEIQKLNIPDYRPRMERFKQAVHKVRMIQRLKLSRGYAFSQLESGQADLIRVYDTTQRKPKG